MLGDLDNVKAAVRNVSISFYFVLCELVTLSADILCAYLLTTITLTTSTLGALGSTPHAGGCNGAVSGIRNLILDYAFDPLFYHVFYTVNL